MGRQILLRCIDMISKLSGKFSNVLNLIVHHFPRAQIGGEILIIEYSFGNK